MYKKIVSIISFLAIFLLLFNISCFATDFGYTEEGNNLLSAIDSKFGVSGNLTLLGWKESGTFNNKSYAYRSVHYYAGDATITMNSDGTTTFFSRTRMYWHYWDSNFKWIGESSSNNVSTVIRMDTTSYLFNYTDGIGQNDIVKNENGVIIYPLVSILPPIVGEVEMDSPLVTSLASLLPLLIPLLISLIGFWKAWRMFSRILKTV